MSSSGRVLLGRKRVLPVCPNPLFLQWLTELRDQAREKGLKTQHTYQKAIGSLTRYPLPLENAREAKILQNFGDGICKILDEKLQKYYRENGPDAPIHSLPKGAPPPGGQNNNNNLAPNKKTKAPSNGGKEKGGGGGGGAGSRKKREYVPQKRSGGYAVLVALYRHNQIPGNKDYMLKLELQAEAQHLCDKSFTVGYDVERPETPLTSGYITEDTSQPDLGSKYTAWSSVSTLVLKDLVLKTHNPARYSLTEQGMALAERLDAGEPGSNAGHERGRGEEEEEDARNAGEDEEQGDEEEEEGGGRAKVVDLTLEEEEEEMADMLCPTERPGGFTQLRSEVAGLSLPGRSQALETTTRRPQAAYLLPGRYDIVLCVDFIETTGGSKNCKQDLVKELQKNGVTFDVRKLNIGDFLWVAKEKVTPVPGQLRAPPSRELVLDYIIERKRIDDLCGSIIDGRFREQKFRLKRCGLHKPIYLVEECGTAAAHLSIPESTLQQAIINTQVVDGFFVKRVQDVKESVAYLTVMTRYLTRLYQNKTLFCHSRDPEVDGGSEVDEARENPSSSLISFAEFNLGSLKNKCQTVREVFARQLMQVSGLSGDKAAAILELYQTPHSLLTAYEQCRSEAEKEKLLSSIRYGKLKRNLGPALSRTVYQLYSTQGPLS